MNTLFLLTDQLILREFCEEFVSKLDLDCTQTQLWDHLILNGPTRRTRLRQSVSQSKMRTCQMSVALVEFTSL